MMGNNSTDVISPPGKLVLTSWLIWF